MSGRAQKLWRSGWSEALLRWLLGAVFVYSAVHKLWFPAQFAKIVYGYQLVPAAAVNIVAILLPYLEITAGLCLLLGVFPRSAALLINLMLTAFIAAIAVNLLRGVTFDCGCFSFGGGGHRSSAVELLIRDVVYLAMGLRVMLFSGAPIGALKPGGVR